MISVIRSPIALAATAAVLLAVMATTSVVSAHSHHHDHHNHDDDGGFRWSVDDDGQQSQAEAITNCLCWNATSSNWCHHALDGHNTGFWRDSCARVVYRNTWWWIPVVLWCIYLILMPLFFCACRLCCNCCGGRTPSFGCCCPISNGILSPDPKWVRPYSKCATWTAKILALIVCIVIINTSVHVFTRSHMVHSDVEKSSAGLQTFVSRGIDTIRPLSFSSATQTKPSWLNSAAFGVLNRAESVIPTLETIHHDLGKAAHADRKGRMEPTNFIVGIPLTVTLLVTILAFCNVRSWPISCAAGLVSFITVVVLILASITLTVSTSMAVYCDNTEAIKHFTKQMMAKQEYCNMTDITLAVNDSQTTFGRYLCADKGLSHMLAAGDQTVSNQGFKASFCDESMGGMFANGVQANMDTSAGLGMPAKAIVVNNLRLLNILNSAVMAPVPDSKLSIAACAADTTCAKHAEMADIMSTFNVVAYSMNYIMENNYECQVVDAILDGVVSPTLCASSSVHSYIPSVNLRHDLQNVAGYLFGIAIAATISFWVWMNGSKRFTKAASKDELLGHHAMQRERMTGLSYDYQNHNNQQTQPQTGIVQGVYDNGVNGPKVITTTAAVAGTTAQPLLLSHDTPTYGSGSVNNRQADDVDLPVKQQPEAI